VFDFEAIEKSPNTNAAHRMIRWAPGRRDAVVEALSLPISFEGRDIGDPTVLADIVSEAAGMERLVVLQLLSEGATRESVPANTRWPSKAVSLASPM
jgi:predicted DsbA family dithiol-disulfide isomerase